MKNQKLTGEPVCEVRQHVANASGKEVHGPLDMQHVIAAAQHAKAQVNLADTHRGPFPGYAPRHERDSVPVVAPLS